MNLKQNPNASYLGDGLYVDHDGYQFRLYTDQGMEVFLEPPVLEAFMAYIKKFEKPK